MILIHIQKDFIVVASKACTCLVFHTEHVRISSNISNFNLNRHPRPFKKKGWGGKKGGKAVIYSGFKTINS